MVRRNLAAEALHPVRVALYAPARWHARDSLVRDLLGEPGSSGVGGVAVRPAFRRAMFDLLVYMSLGARLAPEALDEVQELQMRMLRSITSFPIFSFFPALTNRLFRWRWEGYVAVRRRQEEIFLPLIRARRERERDGGPPCYADSLLALRVADEGGRPLTDAETLGALDFSASDNNSHFDSLLMHVVASFATELGISSLSDCNYRKDLLQKCV